MGRRLATVALVAIGAAWLANALAVRPARADVLFQVASARANTGDLETALQVYGRAETLCPHESTYVLAHAVALGNVAASASSRAARDVILGAADDALGRALGLDPADAHHLRTAGEFIVRTAGLAPDSETRTGRLRSALPLLEKAAALAPAYPDAYADRAQACFELGDREQATVLLQRALRADARRVRAHHEPLLRALGLYP